RRVVEHPQPLLARRKRRVGRERAQLDLDLGCEFGDLGSGRAERASQLLAALPARPVAKRLDERKIRRGRFVLVAAATQNRRTGFLRVCDQVLRKPRLAHTWLAREQHEMASRLLCLVPVRSELLLLAAAADEL